MKRITTQIALISFIYVGLNTKASWLTLVGLIGMCLIILGNYLSVLGKPVIDDELEKQKEEE